MPVNNEMILVKEGDQVREIARNRVFFTFASGRLAYDCVTCKAQCCRGYGYLLTSDEELQGQVGGSPSVALFLDQARGKTSGTYQVHNCPPSCFFLTESHLCRIHRDQGYDSKPETCRLFPFNDFRLFDDYLVVRPHSMLCPLEIRPFDDPSTMSDHEELFGSMALKGISASVTRCPASRGGTAHVLATERHLMALSEAHLREGSYLAFTAAQLAVTAGESGDGMDWNGDVQRFTTEVCRLLATAPPPPGASAVARTLIAMTPYLRFHFILNESTTTDVPSKALAIGKVPYALLTLYIITECARSVGMTHVTFQTVTRLLKDFLPVLVLCASLDQVMTWRRRAPVPVPRWERPALQSSYVGIAKALLPSSQRKTPTRLGDLLRLHCPSDDMDRLLFLKDLARNVEGRITPVDDATTWTGKRRVGTMVGSVVHRLALAHLSVEALGTAYARATRSSVTKLSGR